MRNVAFAAATFLPLHLNFEHFTTDTRPVFLEHSIAMLSTSDYNPKRRKHFVTIFSILN